MKLKEKLLELKKEVCIMQKNASGYGYDYVTEDSILLKINEKMIELKVSLTPEFVPNTLTHEIVKYVDSKAKEKTDVIIRSEMQYVWEDIESGEKEIVPWGMAGQQSDASQSMGSGLTYSNRYFLLKYFNIATSKDDPDAIRSKLAEEEQRKTITSTQTKIKKIIAKLTTKYQTQAQIYKACGYSKEEFIKIYNDPNKTDALLEQLEKLFNA